MNRKRISLLLLLILVTQISTGCWDRHELEDYAYVVALGIDNAPDTPYEKIITAQLVVPSKLAGGGNGGGGDAEKSFFQITVRSSHLFSALNEMNAVVSRRISLLQCRAVFFSEALAKNGIAPAITALEKYPELRRTLFVSVVSGQAKDFLQKNIPHITPNITKYWEEVAVSNRWTGYTAESTLQKLTEGVSSEGEDAVLTLVGLGKTKPVTSTQNPTATELPSEGGTKGEFIGVAAFKQDRMVGKLGKEEAEALNIIRGDWRAALFSIPDPTLPSRRLGFLLRQDRAPRIRVNLTEQPPQISVELNLIASLGAQFTPVDFSQPDNRRKLETCLEDEIELRSSALVSKAQHEFGSDILKLGDRAVREQFLTWKQWEDFNWPEKFPTANINVTADVDVLGLGAQKQPTYIK